MAISLDDIQYFCEVAYEKNLTRASEKLGVSQPALSYSIKRLEKSLETSLLIRLKNGVQLTHFGSVFLERCQSIRTEWNDLENFIQLKKERVMGSFRLGLHPSVALYSLEHFLPQLLKEHVDLKIELLHDLSRNILEQVIDWHIDFALVINPKAHPDLVIKELCLDTVKVFYSDINNTKLIGDPNLQQTQSIFSKLKKTREGVQLVATSGNLEVIAKLASCGVGMAILPERVAKNYKNLKVLKGAPTYKDRLCLIYRHEKQKTLASQVIIKSILRAKI